MTPINMILIAIVIIAVVGYLLAHTAKGQAEVASIKSHVTAEIATIKPQVSAEIATIKQHVSDEVAKVAVSTPVPPAG